VGQGVLPFNNPTGFADRNTFRRNLIANVTRLVPRQTGRKEVDVTLASRQESNVKEKWQSRNTQTEENKRTAS